MRKHTDKYPVLLSKRDQDDRILLPINRDQDDKGVQDDRYS